MSSASVRASGFATARFGGLRTTAADAQPTALYYNPGAIGLLDGHHLMLDATLALRTASYRRFPGAIDDSTLDLVEQAGLSRQQAADALAGEATLEDVVALPFVGAVSDLGLANSPLRFGAAFYVPFGGQSSWDQQASDPRFPGAVDGPARWYNIEGTIRSFALTLGAAYTIEAARLSLGVSGNLYLSEVHTVRARNAGGSDNLVAADGALIEGRSLLDVSGRDFGLGVGAVFEAVEDRLWLGASYTSQPGFGSMELEGQLHNTLGSGQPAPAADVVFTQELPDIVRLGVRGRPAANVELRLGVDLTRWSHLERMCLARAEVSDVDAACVTEDDGSLMNDQYATDVIQIFARDWHDALGVSLSGSYFLRPEIELYAGAGYDGNAVPATTLDPALIDMHKFSFSVGGSYALGPGVALQLTLTEVLYLERDTRGVVGNEALAQPSRQPANAGVYTQNVVFVQPGVLLAF